MAARLEKALQDARVGLKVLQVLTENSYDSILVTPVGRRIEERWPVRRKGNQL